MPIDAELPAQDYATLWQSLRAELAALVAELDATRALLDEQRRLLRERTAERDAARRVEQHLIVALTQGHAANARLQSLLEPARLRAWALYEAQRGEGR